MYIIGIEWNFRAFDFVKHGVLTDTSARLWEYKNWFLFLGEMDVAHVFQIQYNMANTMLNVFILFH